ncbi:MAG: argininosuccinate synthase [Planctomycetota bacterium]
MTAETVVLAFSGGLDTSWCVPWLRETRGARVVTVTVDVGGFDEAERARLAARSAELGAVEHHHLDARERFFDEVLRHLIAGNVTRGHLYPLCVGAERGIQARLVAETARDIGAGAVVHGCTAAGNDQIRFEIALRALAPELEIVAPIRDLAPSREDEVRFLEERGFAVAKSSGRYSINSGLWGVSIGGVETNGTTASIPEEAWVRTRGAFEDPRPPRRLRLGFTGGVPSRLDDRELAPVALIEELDGIAAALGIGRGIHLGDTILGAKGRVAFEAPAAAVILTAHRELEKLVLSGPQQRVKDELAAQYGEFVHTGRALEGLCRDIEAFFGSSQRNVTGEVSLLLRPGSIFVEGVSSPHSIHAASRSVYGEAVGEWTPEDARGFAAISALPSVLAARVAQGESRS